MMVFTHVSVICGNIYRYSSTIHVVVYDDGPASNAQPVWAPTKTRACGPLRAVWSLTPRYISIVNLA